MAAYSTILEHGKAVAAALGVTTAIWTGYTTIGLPVPATISYVESKFSAQNEVIESITFLVLEGQMEQIDTRRAGLRSEKFHIDRTVNSADPALRASFERRLGQIADELVNLDRREIETSGKLKELKTAKKTKAKA